MAQGRRKTNINDLYSKYIEKRVKLREKGYSVEKVLSKSDFKDRLEKMKDRDPGSALTTLTNKIANNQRVLSYGEVREIRSKSSEEFKYISKLIKEKDISRKELYYELQSKFGEDGDWKRLFWSSRNEAEERYFY